jgi:hypothetical protein
LVNNELVTAVLCFGSHICNQAARIRVKHNSIMFEDEDILK